MSASGAVSRTASALRQRTVLGGEACEALTEGWGFSNSACRNLFRLQRKSQSRLAKSANFTRFVPAQFPATLRYCLLRTSLAPSVMRPPHHIRSLSNL